MSPRTIKDSDYYRVATSVATVCNLGNLINTELLYRPRIIEDNIECIHSNKYLVATWNI